MSYNCTLHVGIAEDEVDEPVDDVEGDEAEWEEEARHFVDLTDAVGSHVLADLSASLLVLGAASNTVPHLRRALSTSDAR